MLAQLDAPLITERLQALFAGDSLPVPSAALDKPDALSATDPDRVEWGGIAAAIGATMVIGALGWWGTNAAGNDGIGVIVLSTILGLIVGGAALVFVGIGAGRRASARARYGVTATLDRGGATANISIAVGLAAILGGALLSSTTMHDRGDDTVRATVQTALAASEPGSENNVYTLQVGDAPARIELVSKRHLRLSEEVFVRLDATSGKVELVGALDDGRFAIAVVLWLLGLGAVTSGIRQRRWLARCRRLYALSVAQERG